MASTVKIAIVGVGNCATSLIQGVEYYRNATVDEKIPALMRARLRDYHVGDIEFVAACDVHAAKVGQDLSDATRASRNCTITITELSHMNITVQRGVTL